MARTRARVGRAVRCGIGLVAGLLVTGIALVGPGAAPAFGCSCAVGTDAEAFVRADAVFVGEVVDYEPPRAAEVTSSTDPATWTFAVSEVYKGEVVATQRIVSEWSGASCGLELPHEGEFIVFATRSGLVVDAPDGAYYAGLCGGTRSTEWGPLAVDASPSPPIGGSSTPTSPPTPAAAPATAAPATDLAATSATEGESSSGPSRFVVLGAIGALVVAGAVGAMVLRRSA